MARDDGSGTAPTTGGGGSSADLELTIEDVEKIGQDTAALTNHTETARTKLATVKGEPSAFGSYAPAQALSAQHQAVVEVFEKTLAAITTDMDDFGAAIVHAARNHAQTDADVLATLQHIGSTVGSTVHRVNESARNEAGYDLLSTDDDLDTNPEVDEFGEQEEVGEPALDQLRGDNDPSLPESTAPVFDTGITDNTFAGGDPQ